MIIQWLIQFNILLFVFALLWRCQLFLANVFDLNCSQKHQLIIFRWLFIVLVFLPIPILLSNDIIEISPNYLEPVAAVIPAFFEPNPAMSPRINEGYWQIIVVMAFFVGLTVVSIKLARQWLALRTLIGRGILWRRVGKLHIVFSREVRSPFSTKILGKNHIVIPISMIDKPEQLNIALKHEGQHLRNGDLWWVIIFDIFCTLFFYNPIAYWWRSESHQLQELACDETLVKRKKLSALVYGNCLLDVAEQANQFYHPSVACSNMAVRYSLIFLPSRNNPKDNLKRRVVMLTNMKSISFEKLKAGILSGLMGVVVSVSALFIFFSTQLYAAANVSEYKALERTAPVYPVEAAAQKQEGWVVVEFTIRADGSTEQVGAITQCLDQAGECVESDTFTDAAIQAVTSWRFQPRIVDGEAVTVDGVRTKLTFALGNNNGEKS